ncbi:pyruvate kinase [Streptococcus parauberis]|uniref:pyruvate kinase n=1 Tax=Streptococcus parauberis TaxID=1348 RepID=UPI0037933493
MEKMDIIATIGPSLNKKQVLLDAFESGLTIIRINNSHLKFGDIIKEFDLFEDTLKNNYKVLFDTQGPEIRIGNLLQDIEVIENDNVTFVVEKHQTEKDKLPIDFKEMLEYIELNDYFYIDDGKIMLKIFSKNNSEFTAKVMRGGTLKSRKGLNFPNQLIKQEILSEQDKIALNIIAQRNYKIDKLALSFVNDKNDIIDVRLFLEKIGIKCEVIAKIENMNAVNNFDEILEVSDGIMIARGDLAVEVGYENVPYIQKKCLIKAQNAGKYSIVATQILDSMERNSLPTKAEISDATNALFDGTRALMLSGETAVGKYPVDSVKILKTILNFYEEQQLVV